MPSTYSLCNQKLIYSYLLNATLLADHCARLAERDPDLAAIIAAYGIPPMWTRGADYANLVHLILEQQVSIASAVATLERLRGIVPTITPEHILAQTDEALRACGLSRQKIQYVRNVANAILSGSLDLATLAHQPDDVARAALTNIKGIGAWTADCYLLHSLGRTDLFPIGDVALRTSLRTVKGLAKETTHDELLTIAATWQPYRSAATFLLWHDYLCKRGRTLD